ncbi:MAG: branched-chain amino acid ABC transporter permease [Actinobacteria bacterium]|nr:branched-chain amino acid ABC transporter permease [Actinomycetota bacterium]
MYKFLNTVLIGITSGAIYSLMALALVLVWRSTRVVNFAQAGQALLSTYIGYEVIQNFHSFWLALAIAMVAGAAVAALIDAIFMRTLFKRAAEGPIAGVAPIIATLGLLGLIRALLGLVVGGKEASIRPPVSNIGFTISGHTLAFSPLKLLIVASVLFLMLVLSLIFQHTNVGLALRASAYAPEIARLAGVKVDGIRTLGWALAGAAGAAAGMLQTPDGNGALSPDSLEFSLLLVFGFIAAVIGGLESLVGAVLGGLLLGLVLAFVLIYISGSLVFITAFVLLIIVLLVKPGGLIGSRRGRRA